MTVKEMDEIGGQEFRLGEGLLGTDSSVLVDPDKIKQGNRIDLSMSASQEKMFDKRVDKS